MFTEGYHSTIARFADRTFVRGSDFGGFTVLERDITRALCGHHAAASQVLRRANFAKKRHYYCQIFTQL